MSRELGVGALAYGEAYGSPGFLAYLEMNLSAVPFALLRIFRAG